MPLPKNMDHIQFTDRAIDLIRNADEIAKAAGHKYVGTVDIIAALLTKHQMHTAGACKINLLGVKVGLLEFGIDVTIGQ